MATAELTSSLARWSHAAANERANAQLFLTELTDLLGVPRPGNDHAAGYSFEFPVKIPIGPGAETGGFIDLYRRGCVVLETKQFTAPKPEPTDIQLAAVASGRVGVPPAGSGVSPERTSDIRETAADRKTATQDASLGGRDAHPTLSLLFAIPDHPSVDTAEGAAVRIAMTVGAAGALPGELRTVTVEEPHNDGSSIVTFAAQTGRIAPDLTTGADVAGAVPLKANDGLTYRGVQLIGSGFIVTRDEAKALGFGSISGLEKHIREYRNGRDLMDSPRDVLCIDLVGLAVEEVRQRFPATYQHVPTTVKPERDANDRESYRRNWWIAKPPKTPFRMTVRFGGFAGAMVVRDAGRPPRWVLFLITPPPAG